MPPLTKNKKELLAAIKNFDEPEALKKVLDSRQEELNFALEQTLERVEMPRKRKLKLFDVLLDAGASPNAMISKRMLRTNKVYLVEPLLIWAFNETDYGILYRLFANPKLDVNRVDQKGQTLLHIVSELGFTDLTEELLKKGANANITDPSGYTALFYAIKGRNWEAVEMLLPKTDLSITTELGETAIHMAVKYKEYSRPEQLIEHLIQKGVDVDALAVGSISALDIACHKADVAAVKALIEAGCDVHLQDNRGKTLLNRVVEACLISPDRPQPEGSTSKIVRLLIEAGADIDADPRFTPVMAAMAASQWSVVSELLAANCQTKMLKRGALIYDNLPRNRAIRRFMTACYKAQALDCASYLLLDCCTAPRDQEVQELFFRHLEAVKETLTEQGILPPPVSLARLCRVVIRSTLPRGRTFQPALNQLCLPQTVKDFVMLKKK